MKTDISKINSKPGTLEDALKVISQLVEIVVELKKENESLREQLKNNSSNSSLPPSQDFKKKKKTTVRSGRNRGGQPGHKAWQRIQIPPEQVSEIITCKPNENCECGGAIKLSDKVIRQQVFEIPVAAYDVIEYQIYKGCCESCSRKHLGKLPSGISNKGFGPRAQAMASLLTSKYRLSKRLVQAWFKDVYKMPLCLGSVSNIEHTVSKALQPTHEEMLKRIRNERVVHLDETGHKENNKSAWAWVMSSKYYTFFKLHHSRGKKVAQELIGGFQNRIFITDRYAAYNYLPDKNHQVCWAHLKRDFQKISERTGEAGEIGRALLKTYERIFCFWETEYKANELPFMKRQRKRLRYFKSKLIRCLWRGAHCQHEKTSRTCKNILDCAESLWQFFESPDVPPTNNHAERQLRPLVISKKLTFGTQSDRGSRFIERIFSVTATCKQHSCDVFGFIQDAIQKYFAGEMPTFFVTIPAGA